MAKRRRTSRAHIFAAALSGCFFVTACGDDSASVSSGEPIQTPKKVDAKTATSKDTPEEEPEDRAEFSYSPVGKRDPFRSYLADLTEAQTEVQRRPVQATERFELDQYRLTGLITGTSQPKALVEDPEGIGHTVRIGSYMGRNGGIVTRITSDGIIVTEEFRAPTGELVKVPIAVKLPRPDIEIVGSR